MPACTAAVNQIYNFPGLTGDVPTERGMDYRKKRIDGTYHLVVIIMENTKQDKRIENNGRLMYTGYSWKLFLRDNHLSRDLNEVKRGARWLSGGILFLADESTVNLHIR